MTRRLRLRQQARTEIDEAAKWYHGQRAGLGAEFVAVVDTVTARVLRRPEAYPIVAGQMRRAPVRRFPYLVFYQLYGEEIVILGCIHERRDPQTWQSRV
jgi:plasmid stabilization system protein ParE